jgi:3-oxoacyl-[acyl-carrier protein] reductase
MDVSIKSQVEQAVIESERAFGRIDLLVNNAGITRDAMLHKMTEAQFDAVIAVHLKGTWLCSQAVVHGMRERRYGKMINMSSINGKVGNIGQTNYCMAKAGIIGFTKALAKELAGHQINVNAIMPGFIDTEMTRAISEDVRRQKALTIPLGGIGYPEDIARAAVFLASEESSYMTGGVIEVAGGLYM